MTHFLDNVKGICKSVIRQYSSISLLEKNMYTSSWGERTSIKILIYNRRDTSIRICILIGIENILHEKQNLQIDQKVFAALMWGDGYPNIAAEPKPHAPNCENCWEVPPLKYNRKISVCYNETFRAIVSLSWINIQFRKRTEIEKKKIWYFKSAFQIS